MTSRFHLAQINVAQARALLDDPQMAAFVAQIDAVNAIADNDSGLVWRLKAPDGGGSSYIQIPDNARLVVNISVWRSLESLQAYVYRTHEHTSVFRRRREWFEPIEPRLALWWIRAGEIPTVENALARLEMIRRHGPTSAAFTFKAPVAAPDL